MTCKDGTSRRRFISFIHHVLCRQPERRSIAEKLHLKPKGLGDARYVPASQDMGTLIKAEADDLEAFKKLAQGYTLEGHDRPTICIKNSQVNHPRIISDTPGLPIFHRWLSKKEMTKPPKLGSSSQHL